MDKRVAIRLNEEIYEDLVHTAESLGLSVSSYIRYLIATNVMKTEKNDSAHKEDDSDE